ncbi:hypothetical protein [Planctopirus hydrillae]|uniref:Uncharacterized protein n=1 Tax=Planctopirus hydrillae TaxID=1841610 RepID=A0A1C3E4B9_9PLAN|nr:hypothetical protein [Planctopirus hydrillae]ODA28077.1 hypothetical protein A6X21_14545 [Planctopirus hydrillae]
MADIPVEQAAQRLQQLQQEWEREFRQLLREVEQLLIRLQRERFSRLSQGQTHAGDQWPSTEDSRRGVRQTIGIRSRRLANSLTTRTRQGRRHFGQVQLVYQASYAAAFDKFRRLLPQRIPQEWAAQINGLMEARLDRLEEKLRQAGLID